MSIRCTAVRSDTALAELARAVADAKAGAPLRPVTVVVPTNAVGVAARRWLGAHGGVAAIELVTPGRLAERLAGAELVASGRRPVSTPLIDITVRAVLADDAGIYEPVKEHPSTITALRELHRELRMSGPRALEAMAASSERGREAARVSAAVTRRLAAAWYDEADLLGVAVERLGRGARPLDQAVAFLPRPDTGLAAAHLGALGERADIEVLLECTGVADVDADQVHFAAAIDAPIVAAVEPAPVHADVSVVSTTDADEEVRDATRRLVAAARSGVPFARMALVWPVDRPYARLVEHHLEQAGIAWNGRPGTLVTERLVPRFLLDLLQLDRRGVRRTDVFELLADIPVRAAGGARVSVARWEKLARAAGVTRGDHWEPRLAAHAERLREREPPRDADADAAEQLAEFIVGLRRDLGPPSRRRTWREWAEWCDRQVALRLGDRVLEQLDEAERLASHHANKVLDRLRHLDAVSAPVTRSEFRAAFTAEFEVAPGRLGRLGDGVTIGSLAGTAGLDADLTIVLGAADGLLPPAPTTDPLVSDADRRAAGLPESDARARRLRRSLVGHLTTSQRVIFSTPRGDLRANAERLPSRWIAEHAPAAVPVTIASYRAGLIGCPFPAARAEHRVRGRSVAASRSVDELVGACADDEPAARALALRAGRRSDHVTAYDGDLSGIEIDHFPRPVSPSLIETWPDCPHAYFMRYLLGVHPPDEVVDELALSPLERGNIVHETLDRFHRRVIAGELPQPDVQGWTPEHTDVVREIFGEVADEWERSGRTGRAANWFLARRSVEAELLNWFVRDGLLAASRQARVLRSEYRFGYERDVELPLLDGRRLLVCGYADRVDERANGELVITDHKTGKADDYKHVDAADPTEGATRFQLPVYAAAALAARGETPATATSRVHAEYGFFERGGYERYGYTLDADVWQRVEADLQHVVDGIESGLYPAITDKPQFEFYIRCHYCQPDGLGVDERYDEWSRKRADPRLATWFPPAEVPDGPTQVRATEAPAQGATNDGLRGRGTL